MLPVPHYAGLELLSSAVVVDVVAAAATAVDGECAEERLAHAERTCERAPLTASLRAY